MSIVALEAAPAAVLTTRNFARLEAFARCTLPADHPMRLALLDKLAGCRVVEPGDVPADVATLNARISYVVRGRTAESRVLIEPDAAQTFGRDLPVLTPLGLALLGLAAGQSGVALGNPESRRFVRLLSVDYQPEAANRRALRMSGGARFERSGNAPEDGPGSPAA